MPAEQGEQIVPSTLKLPAGHVKQLTATKYFPATHVVVTH